MTAVYRDLAADEQHRPADVRDEPQTGALDSSLAKDASDYTGPGFPTPRSATSPPSAMTFALDRPGPLMLILSGPVAPD